MKSVFFYLNILEIKLKVPNINVYVIKKFIYIFRRGYFNQIKFIAHIMMFYVIFENRFS